MMTYKNLSKRLATYFAGMSLVASTSAFAFCSEEKTIELNYPAASLTALRVNALAGELVLEGDDRTDVRVVGRACADRKMYLDRMDIHAREEGSILELSAIIPYHEKDWHADYAYIDLTFEVPASLALYVKDSSGDLEGYGIRLKQLEDSSGDIHFRNTSGDLSIRDSSGYISVRNHNGNLELQDSSGDIDVADLVGDLIVIRDSSGDIDVESVTGLVLIERDSSGDIDIQTVGRDVTVGADGSGSIKIRDVRGSVEIGSDGSGDIIVNDVDGGFVLMRKGSGDIRTARIQGNINIPEN